MTITSPSEARRTWWRATALLLGLVLANGALWSLTCLASITRPALLGLGAIAWTLGLRHAVDADHIAAIDNVTRKLLREGRRPIAVGFWFAMGHSAVVLIATVAVATALPDLARLAAVRATGEIAATFASVTFLLIMGTANLLVLIDLRRALRRLKGAEPRGRGADGQVAGAMVIAARPVCRLLRVVSASWHMALIGLLFGLGFDAAGEVTLLAVSSSPSGQAIRADEILLLPGLFAAGMALLDTLDGVIMLGAYGWAAADPGRALRYNILVTGTSAMLALAIGAVEATAVLGGRLGLNGSIWDLAFRLWRNAGAFGALMATAFALIWLASWARSRLPHARGHALAKGRQVRECRNTDATGESIGIGSNYDVI